MEGSQALAEVVALCRPQVIAAYPITPQTHIVEAIARLVAEGRLAAEVVSVESEHSAASVVLGSAAAGARSFTASSSQGILLMSEVLYAIAGMRIPLVLICANRALSAPISIWNDQQDSMAVRDAGWIQLYCTDSQEAVDTIPQAFRIAERLEVPVMVCMDGYVLTHTVEPLELPTAAQVDGFLPPYAFSRSLDPRHAQSHGTLAMPEFYTETRHALHRALHRGLAEIEAATADWQAASGRRTRGLLELSSDPQAEVGVLTLGSVGGTIEEAARQHPTPLRRIRLRAFRPFPDEALRAACEGLRELIVLERCLSPGAGGIVGCEVRAALQGLPTAPRVHDFAVGLGGRDVPLDLLSRTLETLGQPQPEGFSIFDVKLAQLPAEDR